MNYKHIFCFCFLEFVFWCLLSLIYFTVSGFYPSLTGAVFTAFFIPGHIFIFTAGLCLLLCLLRLIGPRTAYWGALTLGTLANLILLADILVYTQYRFHISLAMLRLFFGPAGREIFTFSAGMYCLLAACAMAIAGMTWGLLRLARKMRVSGKIIALVSSLLFLLFAGYNAMYAWGKFMAAPAVLTQMTALPWTMPLSMNRRLRKMGFEPKMRPYETPRTDKLYYPLQPLSCTGGEKLNILVILIDSWRADSFSAQVMPRTWQAYKNAPNAFYFTNHLANANATEAGVFSLFYSIPYSYYDAFTASETRPALMQTLDDLGYQFGIYASSKLNSPAFNHNVFSHIHPLRIESNGNEKWERDKDAQEHLFRFLDERESNRPFFGFLFYDSAHGFSFPNDVPTPFTPYAQQVNYLLLNKYTDPTPYLNRYKNSVHHIDRLLGEVFEQLKKRGLDKNTIIILTADHGQEINDTSNNFWGHNSNFSDYQTHVPLLVWWPNKMGGIQEYRTSHYDIVPALLTQALGCTNPAQDYSSGQDLFDVTPRPWTLLNSYTNQAAREGDIISVLNKYGAITNYDGHYRPSSAVSAQALADIFRQASRFYNPASETAASSQKDN